MLMFGEEKNMDWWGEDEEKAREKQEISSRPVSARRREPADGGARSHVRTGWTHAEPHTRGLCPSPSGFPLTLPPVVLFRADPG